MDATRYHTHCIQHPPGFLLDIPHDHTIFPPQASNTGPLRAPTSAPNHLTILPPGNAHLLLALHVLLLAHLTHRLASEGVSCPALDVGIRSLWCEHIRYPDPLHASCSRHRGVDSLWSPSLHLAIRGSHIPLAFPAGTCLKVLGVRFWLYEPDWRHHADRAALRSAL